VSYSSGNGGYLQLDGSAGHLLVAGAGNVSPWNTQTFTIDMWINRYAEDSGYSILWSQDFTSHNPPYYSVHIRFDNAFAHGGIDYVGGSPFGYTDLDNPANPAFVNNQWNHFVFVKDTSGNHSLYRNGALRSQLTGQGNLTYYSNPIWLGKSNFASSSQLRYGSVRYYNRGLTAGEVATNFEATKTRFGL
jgi:hypothetical protein